MLLVRPYWGNFLKSSISRHIWPLYTGLFPSAICQSREAVGCGSTSCLVSCFFFLGFAFASPLQLAQVSGLGVMGFGFIANVGVLGEGLILGYGWFGVEGLVV